MFVIQHDLQFESNTLLCGFTLSVMQTEMAQSTNQQYISIPPLISGSIKKHRITFCSWYYIKQFFLLNGPYLFKRADRAIYGINPRLFIFFVIPVDSLDFCSTKQHITSALGIALSKSSVPLQRIFGLENKKKT